MVVIFVFQDKIYLQSRNLIILRVGPFSKKTVAFIIKNKLYNFPRGMWDWDISTLPQYLQKKIYGCRFLYKSLPQEDRSFVYEIVVNQISIFLVETSITSLSIFVKVSIVQKKIPISKISEPIWKKMTYTKFGNSNFKQSMNLLCQSGDWYKTNIRGCLDE